jgi:hypothetical protein
VLTYRPTNADRAELPVSYLREPRYLGYREIEGTRPFAKYFAGTTRPVQAHVRHALLAGMAPPEYGYDVDDAVRRLADPATTTWKPASRGSTAASSWCPV